MKDFNFKSRLQNWKELLHDRWGLLSVAVIIFIFVCGANHIRERKRWDQHGGIIQYDIVSYYSYLPAFFYHHDLSLSFFEDDPVGYAGAKQFWPETTPDGKYVIKTTMGMSVMYLPWFLAASIEANAHNYPVDGFSKPYHTWIHWGCFFYAVLGLFFLRAWLKKIFDDWIVAAAILIIGFGTICFYYFTEETTMSHSVNFMLIAAFGLFSHRWNVDHKIRDAVAIGIISGFIILVRAPNAIVCPLFILYGVTNRTTLLNRFRELWKFKLHIAIILSLAVLLFVPQMVYWKIATGQFFFYSYMTESFYFANSHVLDGLFGYRKGWILYSPVMIFSLIGFVALYKNIREYFLATLFAFLIFSYVTFSWWCWWYGGSYGGRPMVDISPVMAIPLAAFIQWTIRFRKAAIRSVLISVLMILCVHTYRIMNNQMLSGFIHWDSMTKKAYWSVFWDRHISNEQILQLREYFKEPDYKSAARGEEEYLIHPE